MYFLLSQGFVSSRTFINTYLRTTVALLSQPLPLTNNLNSHGSHS